MSWGSCKVHEGVDVPLDNTIALFSFVLMLVIGLRFMLLDKKVSEKVSNLLGDFISATISDEGGHGSPESDVII